MTPQVGDQSSWRTLVDDSLLLLWDELPFLLLEALGLPSARGKSQANVHNIRAYPMGSVLDFLACGYEECRRRERLFEGFMYESKVACLWLGLVWEPAERHQLGTPGHTRLPVSPEG